jgi:hypothetical protein
MGLKIKKIQQKTYQQSFMIITWYKHERIRCGILLLVLGKIEETLGVNRGAFFTRLKLPVQKHESPRDGKSGGALSQLPCLYQVLIDDLQF